MSGLAFSKIAFSWSFDAVGFAGASAGFAGALELALDEELLALLELDDVLELVVATGFFACLDVSVFATPMPRRRKATP